MDKNYSDKETFAIVRLMQTEDEGNCVVLKKQLSHIIKKQPTDFKNVISKEFRASKPAFLQTVLEDIYLQDLKYAFTQFSIKQNPNLEEGVALISKDHVKNIIDKFSEELSDSLTEKSEPEDICKMLTQGIFSILGFDIKVKDLTAQDIYFDKFLVNKTGGVFNIACLYVMLAKRFGIKLEILDLHGKLLLECDDINFKTNCYIDPLDYGTISSERSLKTYLMKRDINLKLQDIKHFNTRQIVKRILGNLIYVYNRQNPTANRLNFIRECFEVL